MKGCVEAISALQGARMIATLRNSALELAETDAERQWIQKRLHNPTLLLRRGEYVDEETFLRTLREELEFRR